MFFGLGAVGYEAGIVGFIFGIGYAIGLILIGKNVSRIKESMSKFRADTLDDFIGKRYGITSQFVVTLINMTFFLAVLAAQFIALTAFLSAVLPFEKDILYILAASVVVLYTALAGFKGVLFTDVWQFWIITISVIFIYVVSTTQVQWTQITSLDTDYFFGTRYGIVFLIGLIVFLPFVQLVRTDLWQRIACSKDDMAVRRAFYVTAPILVVFYFLFTSIGIYARAMIGPGIDPETSGLTYFLNIIGFHATGGMSIYSNVSVIILSLGIFATLLSTVDTNLNVISVAVSKFLNKSKWNRFDNEISDVSQYGISPLEKTLINRARWTSIVMGCLGLLVARVIPDIVDLIVGAGSMILIFLPTVYFTLYRDYRNGMTSSISIIFGYLAFLFWFILINPKTAFLPGTLLSLVLFVAISGISKNARDVFEPHFKGK